MPGEATHWITNNASNQIGGENGVLNLAGMPCHCSGGPACVIAIRYVMPANCITFSSISEFFILFWRKEPIIFKNHNYGLFNFFYYNQNIFMTIPICSCVKKFYLKKFFLWEAVLYCLLLTVMYILMFSVIVILLFLFIIPDFNAGCVYSFIYI